MSDSRPFRRRHGCRPAWTCALGCAALFASTSLHGQAAPDENRTVNLNYVYAADLGFGGYTLAGLTADVYTLPLSDTLHDFPFGGWALRLIAPLQLGLYRFRATDTDGQKLAIDQQSLSLVPGAELQIPIASNAVLKPFAQFGVAHAFGNGVGNPDSYVYLAGARSVVQWRAGAYTLSLGNAVIYAGDSTIGPGFSEHYVSLQLGGEVRRPLGFRIGAWLPDLGLYAADYYYPKALDFSRFLQTPLRVDNQGEIGFTIGSASPVRMLGLSNPRLGAGYVFGGGLNVWHVTFGFPF